jgi:hypothetical protein
MHMGMKAGRYIFASVLAVGGWCVSVPIVSAETAGQWQERSQIVWNGAERKLVRKTFRVWDPHPELNLEFRWEEHSGGDGPAGEGVSGSGRLIWQDRAAAPYDKLSVHSEYRGDLVNGRPQGFGSIQVESGLAYEGEWQHGLMQGVGTLRLPNGDEYAGEFLAGRPHGSGRYAAADGTVFEGLFRDGQRAAPHVLPTAEASGANADVTTTASPLVKAHVTADSTDKLIRLAQAPGRIVLRVFADRAKNQDFIKGDPDSPSYVYEQINAPDAIRLRLASRQIMDIWKGNGVLKSEGGVGSLGGFSGHEPFAPVLLVVDIGNDGARPAQIVASHIEVEESVTDLQPFLSIRPSCTNDCDALLQPIIEFRNEGWGDVRDARITYAFADQSTARTPAFQTNAGSFAQSRKISVLDGLQASGMNINQVRTRTFRCGSMAQVPACASQLAASGLLGRLSDAVFPQENKLLTRVVGKIEYSWTDSRGVSRQRETPISIWIQLLQFTVPDMAEIASPDPVRRDLPTLKLALDRKSYRIPINYRARLEPRDNRRFALALTADKSSQHSFTFVLELADGSRVTSPKFDLLYFLPRLIVTN